MVVDGAEAVLVGLRAAQEVERPGARLRREADRLVGQHAAHAEARPRRVPAPLVGGEGVLPPEAVEDARHLAVAARHDRGGPAAADAGPRRQAGGGGRAARAGSSCRRRARRARGRAARTARAAAARRPRPGATHSKRTPSRSRRRVNRGELAAQLARPPDAPRRAGQRQARARRERDDARAPAGSGGGPQRGSAPRSSSAGAADRASPTHAATSSRRGRRGTSQPQWSAAPAPLPALTYDREVHRQPAVQAARGPRLRATSASRRPAGPRHVADPRGRARRRSSPTRPAPSRASGSTTSVQPQRELEPVAREAAERRRVLERDDLGPAHGGARRRQAGSLRRASRSFDPRAEDRRLGAVDGLRRPGRPRREVQLAQPPVDPVHGLRAPAEGREERDRERDRDARPPSRPSAARRTAGRRRARPRCGTSRRPPAMAVEVAADAVEVAVALALQRARVVVEGGDADVLRAPAPAAGSCARRRSASASSRRARR